MSRPYFLTGTLNANLVINEVNCGTYYSITGTISDLAASNSITITETTTGNNTTISSGSSTYSLLVPNGTVYVLSFAITGPISQECTFSPSATGIISGSNSENDINCVTNSYSVGGSISGLTTGNNLSITTGVYNTSITGNGASQNYSLSLPSGTVYNLGLSVSTDAGTPRQQCALVSGSLIGTVADANISNINITCVTASYAVKIYLDQTLTGSVTLKNNSESMVLNSGTAPGTYNFATKIDDNLTYSVSITVQPTGQVCSIVEKQFGSIDGADVTLNLNCVTGYMVGGKYSPLPAARLNYHLYRGKSTSLINGKASMSRIAYANGILYYINGDGIYSINTDGTNDAIFAGGYATTGSVDGTGTGAILDLPMDIASDGTNLYFTEAAAGKIRKINITTKEVTTILNGHAALTNPMTLAVDQASQTLYVVNNVSPSYSIYKFNLSTNTVSAFVTAAPAGSSPDNERRGLVTLGNFLYVGGRSGIIERFNLTDGVLSQTIGSTNMGFQDGDCVGARFYRPWGLATDGYDLYVADFQNHRFRKVKLSSNGSCISVSTIAGSGNQADHAPTQTGIRATYNAPHGIIHDGRYFYTTTTGGSIYKIADTGLVGYWPLAGNANDYGSDGGSPLDGSGSVNYVADSGRYATDTAADFNGTTDGITAAAPIIDIQACDVSMAVWFKADAITSSTNRMIAYNGESNANGFGLLLSPTGYLHFLAGSVNEENTNFKITTQWTHAAAVCTNNNQWKIYVNGKPVYSGTLTLRDSSPTDMYIGYSIADLGEYFSGAIADVRVYNRPLNEGEINELAQDADSANVGTSYSTGATGLLSHYGFDNGSSQLADAGALGYTLSPNGASVTAMGKDGDASGAFGSTGSQYLNNTTSQGQPMGQTPSTICAWIKPNAYPTSYMAIVNYGANSNGGRRGLFLYNNGGVNHIDHDGFGTGYSHTVAHTVPLNTWTHLCTTAVPATATQITSEIYVNGSNIAEPPPLAWNTAMGQLRIGYGTENLYYFNGAIDDVRIYNNALSSDQIRQLAVQVPSGLVARYDFTDNDGTPDTDELTDVSGWGNELTNSGMVTTVDRFKLPGAAWNATSSAYSSTNSWPNNTSAGLTLSLWLKPDSLPTTNTYKRIAGNIVYPDDGSKGYALYLANSGGQKVYYMNRNGSNTDCSTVFSLSAGVYNHLAVTHVGTTAIIYVNGAPLTTGCNVSGPADVSGLVSTNFVIGKDTNDADPGIDGDIDDVRVYNRALPGYEVRALTGYHPMQVGTALSNFRLHLQADSFSNLSDGESITNGSVWQDGSYAPLGTGTTGTASGGPTYYTAGFGTRSALQFDGADDFFNFGSPSIDLNGLTICGVYSVTADQVYAGIIEKRTGTTTGAFAVLAGSTTSPGNMNSGFESYNTGSSYFSNDNSNPVLACFVAYGTITGTSFYLNGSSTHTGTGSSSLVNTNSWPMRVGSRYDGSGYFIGKIGDLLLYTVPLTDTSVYGAPYTDREIVECYLSAKYGIEIGHSCP